MCPALLRRNAPAGLRCAHPSHRKRWAPSAHNAADGMAPSGAFLSPQTGRQIGGLSAELFTDQYYRNCQLQKTIRDRRAMNTRTEAWPVTRALRRKSSPAAWAWPQAVHGVSKPYGQMGTQSSHGSVSEGISLIYRRSLSRFSPQAVHVHGPLKAKNESDAKTKGPVLPRHEHKDGGLVRDEGVTEKIIVLGMGQAAVRSWQQQHLPDGYAVRSWQQQHLPDGHTVFSLLSQRRDISDLYTVIIPIFSSSGPRSWTA